MRKHYVLQKDLFKFQVLYSPNETVYFRGFFTSWIWIQKAYLHADPDPKHKKQKHKTKKKVLQWVLVYGLSKSVLRSRSWYFLVGAGAGVKIWRQKHFFYYFLAYFYMKRSRSRCKKYLEPEPVKKGLAPQHCLCLVPVCI